MEPSSERTSAPSGHVGAWNPHKATAPKPPVISSQGSASAQQGSLLTATSSSVNYPDVTLDSGNANSPGTAVSEDDVNLDTQTVVPDYPLDSLHRPQRTSTSSQQGTRQSHDSGSSGTRRDSGNVQSSANVPRMPQAVPAPIIVPAGHPAGTAMSPRTGAAPSNVRGVPHPGHAQPVVPQSNVSVTVNSSIPASDGNRNIRTQDLNVGVVSSRMDIQRHTASALPDLIAHSQIPPPSARPNPAAQRPQVPVDPRTGSHVSRQVDPHSRHRHHHGDRDRRHRSRRHSHRTSTEAEEPCKESCFKCIAVSTSFRWILVVLSLLGVCCVVTGIVLAALHAAGNSFLFLAIMFIGKLSFSSKDLTLHLLQKMHLKMLSAEVLCCM